MATIILKLVGQLKNDYIIKSSSFDFKLEDLKKCLSIKNINEEEFNRIKFISNGTTINNYDNQELNLVSQENPEIIIYLFVTDKELLEKVVLNMFSIQIENEPTEIIDTNTQTIKLFKDPEFLTLLRICISKPEYFNTVSNYITNGNISYKIKMIIEEDFTYHSALEELKTILLNINISRYDILLMSVLQHFEGNINLSLRYIVCNTN
jgi:hypothetical protein